MEQKEGNGHHLLVLTRFGPQPRRDAPLGIAWSSNARTERDRQRCLANSVGTVRNRVPPLLADGVDHSSVLVAASGERRAFVNRASGAERRPASMKSSSLSCSGWVTTMLRRREACIVTRNISCDGVRSVLRRHSVRGNCTAGRCVLTGFDVGCQRRSALLDRNSKMWCGRRPLIPTALLPPRCNPNGLTPLAARQAHAAAGGLRLDGKFPRHGMVWVPASITSCHA